jgi:hypothetical protein
MFSVNMIPASKIGHLSFIALGFLVLVYVGNAVRVWYRLRHIKGPASVAFSKFWLIRSLLNQTNYLDVAEVCEKYGKQTKMEGVFQDSADDVKGSIARIGPNWLVTSEPELIRRMMGVRSPYKRSSSYISKQFKPGYDNILSVLDDSRHAQLRSKMAAGVCCITH